MTTPDPQVNPHNPEDPAKASAAAVPSGSSSVPEMPAIDTTAEMPAPEIPASETPSFPQASAPDFDEATATPGTTSYAAAYDAAVPAPEVPSNQAAYGAQPGGQPGYDQAAYGGQPGGQPGYDQAAYGAQPGGQPGYGQAAYGGQPGYDQAAYGAQPGYGQPGYGQVYAGPPKQWIVAVLLAFFLGAFGVHNFYLGYAARGIIQLILTLTFVGAIVSGIWAFIEFILILMRSGSYGCDAQGQPLQ